MWGARTMELTSTATGTARRYNGAGGTLGLNLSGRSYDHPAPRQTPRSGTMLIVHADRVDRLRCTENSPGEAELAALIDVIEAYEHRRWPLGEITRRPEG
jgi:hypothetical protein